MSRAIADGELPALQAKIMGMPGMIELLIIGAVLLLVVALPIAIIVTVLTMGRRNRRDE
ncbi:MAG: hypothetical protein R3E01_03585 [Pirellulaceae bacterium]